LWKTLFVICSEDVGVADPQLFSTVWSLYSAWEALNKQKAPTHPERLFWTQAVIMLARAKKSRIVDDAYSTHWGTNERLYEIPDYALDSHTARGRRMGRRMPESWDTSFRLENEAADLPNDYTARAMGFTKGAHPLEEPTISEAESRAIDSDFIRPGFPDDASDSDAPEGH